MVARLIVIGLALAVGAGGCCAHLVSGWLDRALPSPVVVPSAVLAGLSGEDARTMRDFYGSMADIVARSEVIKTTLDLRNRHRDALAMAFEKTAMVGKYPGLGERLDKYLLDAIGSTDVPLTPELRQAASSAFASIK